MDNIETQIVEMVNKAFKKETSEDFDRQRYNANLEILSIVKEYIENNPKQRFTQVLWNLSIANATDRFSEESTTTLNRVKIKLQQQEEMKNRNEK